MAYSRLRTLRILCVLGFKYFPGHGLAAYPDGEAGEVGRMRTTTIVAAFVAGMVGAGIGCGISSSGARAETVDLLLVLAADVSRIIDED